MNVFSFTGNLGQDARTNDAGTVTSFSVAVRSGWGDKETTSWITAKLIGKRATGGVVQYLRKGTQVGVSGALSVSTFQKRDGTNGFSVEVVVNDLDLLGGKQERQEPAPAQSAPTYADVTQGTADIPF